MQILIYMYICIHACIHPALPIICHFSESGENQYLLALGLLPTAKIYVSHPDSRRVAAKPVAQRRVRFTIHIPQTYIYIYIYWIGIG